MTGPGLCTDRVCSPSLQRRAFYKARKGRCDLRGTFFTERRREGASIEDIALITGRSMGKVKSTLDKHYLADDQALSDAMILLMKRQGERTSL